MSDAVLEIKNLRKVYDRDLLKKKQVVVDDLSVRFLEGQCTAFMGHNGAGKTTTIRMIFGLINPDKGEILYRGRHMTLEDKRSIGYMPEINKLPLNLTCEEILKHHMRVFRPKHLKPKEYGDAIEQKLKEIELWDHRKKKVGALSKGMGRRLTWAQATIHKPELIILDEPMSGLDPLGHRLMGRLINQLREDKVSIVLCTHELWSVSQLCDQVHILNRGRLVFSTLDPNVRKDELTHLLSVSGASIDQLHALQASEELPPWAKIQIHQHKAQLHFTSYADAQRWLQASLKQGLIVVEFQKLAPFSEERLVGYFGEERKV